MVTKARLTEDLSLAGEIDERLPAAASGLVAHYPFDDSLNNNATDISGAKVLGSYEAHATHPWYDWFNTNADLTNVASIATVSVATALTYDLIVVDAYAWGLSSSIITLLKSFVDAGVSVVAQGNDTTTNVFVYTKIAVAHAAYDVKMDAYSPIRTPQDVYIGAGGTDLYGGAGILQGGAIPYYTRADSGDITGYTYTSPESGASFYFDLDSLLTVSGDIKTAGALFAYNTSRSRITNTNTTLTSEGISVDVARTNVMPYPYASWNGSGFVLSYNNPASGATYTHVPGIDNPINSPEILRYYTGTTAYKYWAIRGTVPSAGTYTFSYYARISSSNAPSNLTNSQLWRDTGVDGAVTGDWNPTITSEWQRYVTTGTVTTYLDFFPIHGGAIAGGYTIDYCGFQLEASSYPTGFVVGARGASALSLPNPITTGDYTVNYMCKINTNIGDAVVYQTTLQMGPYSTSPSWTIMDTGSSTVGGVQRFIREGDGAQWAWLGVNLTETTNFQDWNMITIVRNSSYYRAYSNGVYKGEILHYATTMQEPIWVGSRNGTAGIGSSTIKDLSIYNRALTDAEVKTLANNALSIQPDGDVQNEIIERPMMPDDRLYFPFGSDGKDEYKLIESTHESDVIYEDGGVWFGRGTTNYASLTYYVAWTNSGTGTSDTDLMPRLHVDSPTFSRECLTVGSLGHNIGEYAIADSTIFSASCWVWVDVPATESQSLYARSYDSTTSTNLGNLTYENTGISQLRYLPQKRWIRLHVNNLTSVVDSTFLRISYYIQQAGSIIHVTKPQIELRAYSTPFVPSSIINSRLNLPYEVIDCKSDFTIYGFWKPMTYADGVYRPCICRHPLNTNSTYNRILIMGNGTASRRLRAWHGSDGVAETSVYAPATIDVQDNEWNFFAFVRRGANMELHLGNSDGFGYGTSATASYLNADETSQYWHVGQYSGNESDAYHRDYGFVQSALSLAELDTIFNTKLRCFQERINISNQVIEGVTL